MSTSQHSDPDPSVEYYNKNASAFIERSRSVDMSKAYDRFLSLVPCGGRVLDAGCGSGRDVNYFIQKGFDVEAFDASGEMVKFASGLTGIEVQHLRFDQIEYSNVFDAVWACASLLHVPKDYFNDVLQRLVRALKCGGVMYLSVKEKESVTPTGGRRFYYYTATEFDRLLSSRDDVVILDTWTNEEDGCIWVNTICRADESG